MAGMFIAFRQLYNSSAATNKTASNIGEGRIQYQEVQQRLPMIVRFFLLFVVLASGFHGGLGDTDPQDAAALRSLMSQWKNTPPSWGTNNDPCSTPWEGITCNNARVTAMVLNTMGIKGTLSSDISQLSDLQSLDLSFNSDLGGPVPPSIGNLKQLTT